MHENFTPSALRKFRYFESTSLEHARDSVASVLQPHSLTPVGRAKPQGKAHMDLIHVGDLSLGTLGFGESVHVDAGVLNDFFLIVLCLEGHARVHNRDGLVHIGRSCGYVCSPGMPFKATFSDGCEQLFVKVNKRTFDKHAGNVPTSFSPVLDLSRPNLIPWRMQMEMLSSSAEFARVVTQSPIVRTEFERLFIALLMEGQPYQDGVARLDAGATVAPGAVKRAESFIRTNYGEPLCLNDVAAVAGVSARALLCGFKKFRDTTPMQYLRDVRLQHARERLRESSPCSNVTDIALECGFVHLGRFSRSYQELFEELPSETLRKSRGWSRSSS